jgi:DNA-binding HxlR family transcriptional regulator
MQPPYDRAQCPVERTLTLLGGKWRLMVLFRLGEGPMRFNALVRSLAPVSQRVLAETLRGLEADGLIWRQVHAAVPPHVEYGLTDRGTALAPVFAAMADWGARG